ncbi:MAG: methionine aminotransferase [Bacteroidota bacterium]
MLSNRSKLPKVGTTIFSVMSALANEHQAINLSQGFPNYSCNERLKNLVHEFIQKDYNQYAPMPGVLELRQALAQKIKKLYQREIDVQEEITITAGGTQAIFTAINCSIREGDEVIIFEPAYDCYAPAILLSGGIPKYIELEYPTYEINWKHVAKLINTRTKMIIINNPNNPATKILKKDDLLMLEKLTSGTDIIILSDEVYEHLVYDKKTHESILKYPKLMERSFICYSFGKSYHVTGWKIGYCIASPALMREFRKAHQFNVFSVNTPIQYAIAAYMNESDDYTDLAKFYEEKRNYFLKGIGQSRFKPIACEGSYFQLLSYENISEEKDLAFAKRLTIENKIASIPLSSFYSKGTDHKVLRFCFAKTNDLLDKGLEILNKI